MGDFGFDGGMSSAEISEVGERAGASERGDYEAVNNLESAPSGLGTETDRCEPESSMPMSGAETESRAAPENASQTDLQGNNEKSSGSQQEGQTGDDQVSEKAAEGDKQSVDDGHNFSPTNANMYDQQGHPVEAPRSQQEGQAGNDQALEKAAGGDNQSADDGHNFSPRDANMTDQQSHPVEAPGQQQGERYTEAAETHDGRTQVSSPDGGMNGPVDEHKLTPDTTNMTASQGHVPEAPTQHNESAIGEPSGDRTSMSSADGGLSGPDDGHNFTPEKANMTDPQAHATEAPASQSDGQLASHQSGADQDASGPRPAGEITVHYRSAGEGGSVSEISGDKPISLPAGLIPMAVSFSAGSVQGAIEHVVVAQTAQAVAEGIIAKVEDPAIRKAMTETVQDMNRLTPDFGHTFVEVRDLRTGENHYLDVYPREGSPNEMEANRGLTENRRAEHQSRSWQLSEDQLARAVQTVNEYLTSSRSYDPIDASCVKATAAVLNDAGFNIGQPLTPAGLWDSVNDLLESTPDTSKSDGNNQGGEKD